MSLFGTALKQGAKLADNLLDDAVDIAGPYMTKEPFDMTVEEIDFAIKNAEQLSIPGWRVNDLKTQLPKTIELEEARAIRAQSDEDLNNISLQGRASNDPKYKGHDALNFEDMKHWLFDEVWNPSPPVRIEGYSGVDDFPYGNAPDISPPAPSRASLMQGREGAADDFNPGAYLSRAIRGAAWADPAELKRASQLAKDLQAATGIPMEVDHLIPLKGDFVSGLNHQDNLFVMPLVENRLKSNSFDYDEYSAISPSAHKTTSNEKHARFLDENKRLVRGRQDKKKEISGQFSDYLDRQIIDPATRLGRNAKQIWGQDYERYAEDIRRQIGLLGTPSK